jgi:hypothetical protein
VVCQLVQDEVQPPPPAGHARHQVLHKARVPASHPVDHDGLCNAAATLEAEAVMGKSGARRRRH